MTRRSWVSDSVLINHQISKRNSEGEYGKQNKKIRSIKRLVFLLSILSSSLAISKEATYQAKIKEDHSVAFHNVELYLNNTKTTVVLDGIGGPKNSGLIKVSPQHTRAVVVLKGAKPISLFGDYGKNSVHLISTFNYLSE